MKRLICFFETVFLALCLSGCQAVEPEEVYLVSALGFDAAGADVRVVAEVPLTRESETDRMEVRVFEGTGKDLAAALTEMKNGLAKQLEFGHCALVVLGEGIEGERLTAVLKTIPTWEVPLSVTVVCSPDARELLRQGSLSAPAVGYEIPDILQLIASERGESFKCRYYEIALANGNFAVPRFLSNGKEEAQVDRFDGLCKYQNGRRG